MKKKERWRGKKPERAGVQRERGRAMEGAREASSFTRQLELFSVFRLTEGEIFRFREERNDSLCLQVSRAGRSKKC